MIASGYFSQALFGTLKQGLIVTEDYRFELLLEASWVSSTDRPLPFLGGSNTWPCLVKESVR